MKTKYNGNGLSWGNVYPDPSFNNGSESGFAQNNFKGVNIAGVENSFNLPYRLRMPNSIRLMTIAGSDTFISNNVFDPANVALVVKVKEQIENNIFRPENNSLLNLQYTDSIPAPVVSNYGTGYSMFDINAAAFDAITRAASRLISFFRDIGIDLMSDRITNRSFGVKFQDIFMSAYVLSLQIIIIYNTKMANEKAEQMKNTNQQVKDKTTCDNIVVNPNPDNPFAMPDTDIASEHKPLFDGINPNDNGESVIDFPKESDSLSDLFDRMSMSESEVVKPHYPWEKDDNE